jgi:hypothetical protein
MINQEYIDQISQQIAKQTDVLQQEIIKELLTLSRNRRFQTIDQFLNVIDQLDLNQVVNLKAQNIIQSYVTAQTQILADMSFVGEITEETLRAISNFARTSFVDHLGSMGGVLKTEIVKGILGETTERGIFQAVQQQAGLSNSQMQTLVRTGLNDYSASVNKIMIDNAGENRKYRYVGAIDDKTRKFCIEAWEAGPMTKRQIKENFPQNYQGGDPLIERGGYNCRHQWVPIEAEDESKDFRE